MAVTEGLLKQFLSHNLSASEVSSETIETNEQIIIGQLSAAGFPTEDWPANPPIVDSIIAMRAAGSYYAAMTGEVNESGTNYGTRLVYQADRLVGYIIEGRIKLEDEDFVPTATGELQGETDPIFTVGEIF